MKDQGAFVSKALDQYLATALWSSTDENDSPLEREHSTDDFSAEAIKKATDDIIAFIIEAGDTINDLDPTDIGHDFWLTRNRHGAGFWDGDYPHKVGEELTDISHRFKEVDCYVGDDGKVHLE